MYFLIENEEGEIFYLLQLSDNVLFVPNENVLLKKIDVRFPFQKERKESLHGRGHYHHEHKRDGAFESDSQSDG